MVSLWLVDEDLVAATGDGSFTSGRVNASVFYLQGCCGSFGSLVTFPNVFLLLHDMICNHCSNIVADSSDTIVTERVKSIPVSNGSSPDTDQSVLNSPICQFVLDKKR